MEYVSQLRRTVINNIAYKQTNSTWISTLVHRTKIQTLLLYSIDSITWKILNAGKQLQHGFTNRRIYCTAWYWWINSKERFILKVSFLTEFQNIYSQVLFSSLAIFVFCRYWWVQQQSGRLHRSEWDMPQHERHISLCLYRLSFRLHQGHTA